MLFIFKQICYLFFNTAWTFYYFSHCRKCFCVIVISTVSNDNASVYVCDILYTCIHTVVENMYDLCTVQSRRHPSTNQRLLCYDIMSWNRVWVVSAKNCFIKNTLFKNVIACWPLLIYPHYCICLSTWEFAFARTCPCSLVPRFELKPVFCRHLSSPPPSLSSFERCERSFDLWRPDLTLCKIPSLYKNAYSWPIFPHWSCDLALVGWTDLHKQTQNINASYKLFMRLNVHTY